MTEQGNYHVSQGLVVLAPRSGQAYPIPCEEWTLLKAKISKLTAEPWIFRAIGSLLLGAAISTFITILVKTFKIPDEQGALYTAWAITATTAVSGIVCLVFSQKERQIHLERAGDVVAQMDLIEKRYERGAG